MINLMNDYNSTAHPKVIEAIAAAEDRRYIGYGLDEETVSAVGMLRRLVGKPDADIHFLAGGTLTNLCALGAFLRPHEAVVSPASAHINVHETGAIEAVGHKILACRAKDGKADAAGVEAVIKEHSNEHMVKPKLLLVSQTTELGTVYTSSELSALREVCDEYGLYLYIDGARLGCAMESCACDMTLEDIAALADAFYIGGTKNGLLFGEALVICNPLLAADFRFIMKQHGGLLAKGFLAGIQFRAIFEDGLYFSLARRSNGMAARLSQGLREAGVGLMSETVSNQVFLYVGESALRRLNERVLFEVWSPAEEKGTPIRFVTSWQTTEEEIEAVLKCVGSPGQPGQSGQSS